MRTGVFVVALLLVLLGLHAVARADSATAKAAFEQGEKLTLQNKWVEACPLFEASFRADPQLGALLALAECHEQVGRIASSWSELNDALVIAKDHNDARAKDIEAAIAELAPRVPKLKLTPPPRIIPGLTVKRDNVDVTVLVGTEIPTDAGEHEIVAEAPGYEAWRQKVTIKDGAVTALDIAALEKAVAKAAPEGTLKVTTAANAQIILDSEVIGTGRVERKVKAGGHTLRVVATGMRPYQSEIVVGADEVRVIDVPLDSAVVSDVVTIGRLNENGAGFEVAASLGSGFKGRNEKPMIVSLRVEAALRLGKRVNFGFFAEYTEIDTGDHCGFDMPGPTPATSFDFGPRNQFTRCMILMPGLQLYVHILPKRRVDPWIGIAPGFRFGFTDWTPYQGGVPGDPKSEFFPGIVVGVRAGVDYHPRPAFKGWEVGGYVGTDITVVGDEAEDHMSASGQAYLSYVGGVRTSLQF